MIIPYGMDASSSRDADLFRIAMVPVSDLPDMLMFLWEKWMYRPTGEVILPVIRRINRALPPEIRVQEIVNSIQI